MAGLPSRAVARSVTVHKLGRIGYGRSQWLQRALAAEVRTGRRGDTLLLLEHPPVFTLGRLQSSADNVVASAADIAAAGATVHQSERGGNVTFHGPGQLVAYPLLDLSRFRKSVHWYVSALEQTLIQAAAEFGLEARRGGKDETGVWVDDRKLAAIGVSVSRWVTTHGVGLNASTDLSFFEMIVPCGLQHNPRVTSISAETGRCIDVDQASPAFEAAFASVFQTQLEHAPLGALEGQLRQAAAAERVAEVRRSGTQVPTAAARSPGSGGPEARGSSMRVGRGAGTLA